MAPLAVLVACLMAGVGVRAAAPGDGAVREAVDRATGAALQGDLPAALDGLRGVPAARLTGADAAFRTCMLARFGATPAGPPRRSSELTGEPWVDRVGAAFLSYWHQALLRPTQRGAAEAELLRTLQALPGLPSGAADPRALERHLLQALKDRGWFALLGRTGPLRELMLWREQEDREQQVELPEGSHRVRVSYLRQFALFGWSDYATCGRRSTGGWATPEGLFAVVPRYPSLEGEDFAVTFLAHEAQHFSDLTRHGKLPSWRLEYRAKLVELAQARHTLGRLLEKFIEDQSDDDSLPHSHANRRVLQALRVRLGVPDDAGLAQVDTARLNATALQALQADTEQLAARR